MPRLSLLTLTLALAACEKTRQTAFQPNQTLEDFSMSQSRRGKPGWTLSAHLGVLKEDRDETLLTEPRMEFYQDGRVASKVESRHGVVELATHDVLLSSSVVLTSVDENSVLTTDELKYSAAKAKFFTDKHIELRRPGTVLKGRGLEANAKLTEFRIYHQESVVRDAR